jgi:uncharacterized integral membrane protein
LSFLILLLCALFFGTLLLLVTQNSSPVDFQFLVLSYRQVPLSLLLTVGILFGVVFSAFLALLEGARLRLQNRRLHRRVGKLEDQLRRTKQPGSAPLPRQAGGTSPPVDYPNV